MGEIKIKYRNPGAGDFSDSDVILNVTSGVLFYKRNRRIYSFTGVEGLAELGVFPGESAANQILFNEDGVMQGTNDLSFTSFTSTCDCYNTFNISATTVTNFSGSVRIGEFLPTDCTEIQDEYSDPALFVSGNISASGNIYAQEVHALQYIISSSVTQMTTQTFSGSTAFGDTQDDTHSITGSMYVTSLSPFSSSNQGGLSITASGLIDSAYAVHGYNVTASNFTVTSGSKMTGIGEQLPGNHPFYLLTISESSDGVKSVYFTSSLALVDDDWAVFPTYISSSRDVYVTGSISSSGGDFYINSSSGDPIIFATSGSSYAGHVPLVGIGTNTPPKTLTVQGDISASGDGDFANLSASVDIFAPNIGTATDNTVVILSDEGKLKTDEINSDVWNTSLNFVDGNTISTDYISKAVDADTITDSIIFESASTHIGIGTTTPEKILTVHGDISASGDLYLNNGSDIKFYPSYSIGSTSTSTIHWDFPSDDIFIYAHQSSSDYTRLVFESRDNVSNDKIVFWFNDYKGSGSDSFPLVMEGNKVVVNHFYDKRTAYHVDGTAAGHTDMEANNVDFYLLKSGSTSISVSDALIFGDVSRQQVTINGELTASSNISASGNLVANEITASGNIITSGNLYINKDNYIYFGAEEDTQTYILESNNNLQLDADDDILLRPDDDLKIAHSTTQYAWFYGDERKLTVSGSINTLSGGTAGGHITASGNISASGNVSASGLFLDTSIWLRPGYSDGGLYFQDSSSTACYIRRLNTGNELELGSDNRIVFTETDDDLAKVEFDLNSGKVGIGTSTPEDNDALITVAGNISASGLLYISASEKTAQSYKTLVQDTATGRVYYTGSFGSGGGGGGTPGGSDKEVQFNDGGSTFGGDAGFTYDKDLNSITAITNITASGVVKGYDLEVAADIKHFGDLDTKISYTTDQIELIVGGDTLLTLDEGSNSYSIFNKNGIDSHDFIIEGPANGANTTNLYVSSSGVIFAPQLATTASYDHVVTFNTNTGKLNYGGADQSGYTHPTHPGDDFSLDTGHLSGATVIDDIDINISTDTLGHVTDCNGVVATRDLTLGDLGYTGANNATANTGTITQIIAGNGLSGGTITSTGTIAFAPGGTVNGIVTSNGASGHTVESRVLALTNGSTQGEIQLLGSNSTAHAYSLQAGGSYLVLKADKGTQHNLGFRVYGQIYVDDTGAGAGGRGHVICEGDVVAYYTSDKRLKDNITPIKSPLKKLLKIGGYNFEWNDKAPDWTKEEYFGNPSGSLKDVGVIAQELEKVLPEAVKQRKDGFLSVDYEKIIALLIE